MNFSQLKDAVAAGGEYFLTENFQITSPLSIEKDFKLNLNGHNLNINVNAEDVAKTDSVCVIATKFGAIFTIDDTVGTGGIYNLNKSYSDAIFGLFNPGTTIIINGGTILSSEDMLFGSVGGSEGNAIFEINGGTILGYVGVAQGTEFILGQEMELAFEDEFGLIAVSPSFAPKVSAKEGYKITSESREPEGGHSALFVYKCEKK